MGKTKITIQQRKEIAEKYPIDGNTCYSLAKEYGVTPSSINRILKEERVELKPKQCPRKHWLNDNYFEIIDTEEKAYFLGLLYADGCNNDKNNTVSLSLIESDKNLIEKLRTAISPEKSIYFHPRKKSNHSNQYSIAFTSSKLSEDLILLGCTPRKSTNLQLPTFDQVPEKLFQHFIRGYFDGDGCISRWTNNHQRERFEIAIVSSIDFCNELHKFIRNILNINAAFSKAYSTDKVKYVKITGRKSVQRFAKWMYKDATIYMERKYEYYINNIKDYKPKLKSGNRGVFLHPRDKKWVGQIYHKGKTYYLGYFPSKEAAIQAVLYKDKELGINRECDLD